MKIEDIGDLQVLVHTARGGARAGHHAGRGQHGQWLDVRVDGDRSVDDASLAHAAAIAGAGLILKSEIDQRRDLDSGALVPSLTDCETEPCPLHAVLPSGRFIPHRVRALVDFLALKFSAAPAASAS